MLNPRQLLAYSRIFQKYVGKRLIIVFLLSLLAVVVEAFGITLILPLIASLGMESEGLDSGPTSSAALWMTNVVRMLGLQGSTIGIIVFIGVLVGFKGVIRFSADAYGSVLTAQLNREIKQKLFSAYAGMNYAYYASQNTGHFINVINGQVSKLIQSFSAFKTVVIALLTTLAYLGVAVLVDWRFAVMAALFGLAVLGLFRRLNSYVKDLSRKTATESSTLNKRLVQCLQAYKYLSATGNLPILQKDIFMSVGRLARYIRNQGLGSSFTGAVREPISLLLILLIIGVQLILFDSGLAPIVVSIILLYRAMGQIMLLQSSWQNLMATAGSIEVVQSEFQSLKVQQQSDGVTALPAFSHGIELRDVSFCYSSNAAPVLNRVSLSIPARKTVALVGPSGAGKSTLVDLITLLLEPTTGQVMIDGQDAVTLKKETWRKQLGYVAQDTVVFDDTVANNLGLWRGHFSKDEAYANAIRSAARLACADAFIDALPLGYNTLVGDRGIRLSGGQKQRLFIARELFKQPKLLILDEATSALDTESEKSIQQSIDNLRGEVTIIIIAHRLSTVRNADVVCVLEKGRIVELGSYESLTSRKSSRFSKMVAAQML